MATDPTPTANRQLVEGVDYTVESGRWVFTAAYHLARGSCCGSGCRHCPYGHQKDAVSGIEQGAGSHDSYPQKV